MGHIPRTPVAHTYDPSRKRPYDKFVRINGNQSSDENTNLSSFVFVELPQRFHGRPKRASNLDARGNPAW